MLTVDDAQQIVLDSVPVLPAERMPLLDALGCVLEKAVVAQVDVPPFANSAMDGYAVIAQDTLGATIEAPCRLTVVEDLPAGSVTSRPVGPGEAMRIMTGAAMPPGADAVVVVEQTRPGPSSAVEILASAKPGDNVRPAGEDILAGEVALSAGQVLGPGELGLAAALGRTHVVAVRPPRVAIVTTGSELVEPGQELPPGRIYNSNLATLAARVLRAGAQVMSGVHVADDADAVEAAISGCGEADVILTTGGVSVGKYDFVKVALERLGEMKFWRILMRPGSPAVFGFALDRPLFGLPGNPVSVLVTFELLVAPALRRMMGRKDCLPPVVHAILLADLPHKPPRREYRQAVTVPGEDGYLVQPSPKRGSALLSSTVGANSLVIIPEQSAGLRAGEEVDVIYPAYGEARP